MWIFSSRKIKNNKSDEEIITEYKLNGNSDLVGFLFEKYSVHLYGVCLKYLKDEDESKDAVANIFEKLIEDLKRFEIQKFSAWIHTVAKNYCMMKLRNNKMYAVDKLDTFQETDLSDYDNSVNTHVELELKIEEMERALHILAEEQRICIDLFYLQEKCYHEITEITGYNLKQVKSYIQNGKRNLKLNLAKNEY